MVLIEMEQKIDANPTPPSTCYFETAVRFTDSPSSARGIPACGRGEGGGGRHMILFFFFPCIFSAESCTMNVLYSTSNLECKINQRELESIFKWNGCRNTKENYIHGSIHTFHIKYSEIRCNYLYTFQ